MKILITGANGQLGRALTEELLRGGAICDTFKKEKKLDRKPQGKTGCVEFLPVDYQQLDITSEQEVFQVCREYKPQVIMNAAAYTAVEACEEEEELAWQVNAAGPGFLAKIAEELGAKLVHISTDYVFDGQAKEPYKETDLVHPISAYGRTKAEGEKVVLTHCSRAFVIRSAWSFGDGKNFVRTMLRLGASDSPVIRVVNDQFGCPTSAKELARLVLYLADTEQYGIWHGVCEGYTSWYGLAKEVFRLAGMSVDLRPVSTEEYPTKVRRPAWSVLANDRLHRETDYQMKDWKEALREYLS